MYQRRFAGQRLGPDEFVISADEKTSVPFAWCFTRAELERLLGCLAGEERLLAVA